MENICISMYYSLAHSNTDWLWISVFIPQVVYNGGSYQPLLSGGRRVAVKSESCIYSYFLGLTQFFKHSLSAKM